MAHEKTVKKEMKRKEKGSLKIENSLNISEVQKSSEIGTNV